MSVARRRMCCNCFGFSSDATVSISSLTALIVCGVRVSDRIVQNTRCGSSEAISPRRERDVACRGHMALLGGCVGEGQSVAPGQSSGSFLSGRAGHFPVVVNFFLDHRDGGCCRGNRCQYGKNQQHQHPYSSCRVEMASRQVHGSNIIAWTAVSNLLSDPSTIPDSFSWRNPSAACTADKPCPGGVVG